MSEKCCKYCFTTENLFVDKRGTVYAICTKCKPLIDKKRAETTKQNLLEKYGITNVSQLQEVKNKKKETTFQNFGVDYPTQSKKVKATIKKNVKRKYGVENVSQLQEIKDKKRQTCLNNWGVECNLQAEECKDQVKVTCLQKYGKENPHQAEDVINKTKKTNIKLYGGTAPVHSEKVVTKMKNSSYEKYGEEFAINSREVREKIRISRTKNYWGTFLLKLQMKKIRPLFSLEEYISKEKVFKFECQRCFSIIESYETNPIRIRCTCTKNSSKYEDEISEWLESLNIDIERTQRFYKNNSKTERFEIDVYLPTYNVGIEFHGLYWHSHIYKERRYHQEKYLFFKERNIQLIQVFENEWLNKKEIVKSIILSKLNLSQRIYARECVLQEVDIHTTSLFLESNHLQGNIISSLYRIGLYYKNELCCIGVFGKNRFEKTEALEILRFATKINTTVIGGFSKILKYVEKTYPIQKLISFVDPRYFIGNSYSDFTFIELTAPNYFYFKVNELELYSRIQFQKHKLQNKLEVFDPAKSELENMEENGYLRIYDAGHLKFIKNYN